MHNYAGKICPFCKTEFRPEDDVVVCSACDMPHHKDCWIENQGCTTFGCPGTIKAPSQEASSVTRTEMTYEDAPSADMVFCTRCGAKNSASDCFCPHCGNKIVSFTSNSAPSSQGFASTGAYGMQSNQNPPQNAYQNTYQQNYQQQNAYQNTYQQPNYGGQGYQCPPLDEDLVKLIGTNQQYYASKFCNMKRQGSKASWNWPAFLVTPYWLLYRKMYGYGAAVLVLDILVSLLVSGVFSFLALGAYITIGIYANYFYMKHLENKALQAKGLYEPYKSQFIATNGGVNTLVMVLTIVIRTIVVGAILF